MTVWETLYWSIRTTSLSYYMCSVAQSYSMFCDPLDCSPLGSSVHGILQARILKRAVTSSSRGASWHRDWTCISAFPALAGRFFTNVPPWKPKLLHKEHKCTSQTQSDWLFWFTQDQNISRMLSFKWWTLHLPDNQINGDGWSPYTLFMIQDRMKTICFQMPAPPHSLPPTQDGI